MSSEFLEKIRKIIVTLLVLFISILNTWIAFCTLPVHAASNPTGSIIAEVEGAVNDYCNRNIKIYSGNATSLKCAVLIMDESNDVKNMNALIYTTDISSEFTYYSVTTSTWPKNPQNNSEDVRNISSSGMAKVTLSDGTIVRYSIAGVGNTDWSIISNTPCYDPISGLKSLTTSEQAKIFLEHLLVVGDLKPNNGGSDFDPHDDAYAFTGFSMSGKTASWTGTTERSYLLDMDVEEWVNYTYGFATSEDQEVSSFIDAEAHYSSSDKKLALPWDEMEANKKEGEFIRQVNIIPCYGTSGAGFYFGVPCKVFYHMDGSVDKIVRDFPQGSGDYSYKHIFSSDKYSSDIPAPELSAISHNGFALLNNSNNDYYVDIILESNLYGVKMEKNAGTWLPVVDTDWVYNSHYYNFADTSQIAINNDVIYIPNLFSVNPESDLVDDFKKWSSEYSSYSSLPSMSFLKRSTAARTRYVDQFLFKDDSKYSDSEQLKFSHMAESVFYVRYYNKSMVYGPWVRYKFRDGYVAQVIDGTLGGAYIDVGQVDTDDSGNVRVDEKGDPIVSDNVSGRQDYDTGESDFSDGSFSLDLSDVTKFFDYLKKIFESVTGALSSFGSVVAACFGFLPSELINALIFGICVMMFIGIIKAVKG